MALYFIIPIVIFLDQFTKHAVRTGMSANDSFPIIEEVFHITYVKNYGAAFSILQGKQIFLIGVTAVLLVGITIYLFKQHKDGHWMISLALALIVGGGFGNLIDRIRLGYVVDFFDFRVFPVFNIADICVCTGCGILILYLFYFEVKIKGSRE